MSILSFQFLRRASILALWILPGPFCHAVTIAPVAVALVQKQTVYYEAEITGTVTSPRVARLSTATDGLIVALHVEEGDQVATGEPLLNLDPELAQQRLASARAQVRQADAALADAKRRLREAEQLGSKGGIAETVIEDLRSEVAEDEAALSRFRADAALQRAVLDRHTLKAPFAGVISQRLAEAGEWVSPGQGVFELVATEGLRLDFALAEDFLTQISPDTEIEFRLNALPNRIFVGQVAAIVPVAEPGARTFLLRVLPKEPAAQMMPGLSVVATLRNPSKLDALVVPDDAILRYPDGRVVVWVLSQANGETIAEERLVTTGSSFSGLVVIKSGLNTGEQVVIQGNETLQRGQQVRVVPFSQDS